MVSFWTNAPCKSSPAGPALHACANVWASTEAQLPDRDDLAATYDAVTILTLQVCRVSEWTLDHRPQANGAGMGCQI